MIVSAADRAPVSSSAPQALLEAKAAMEQAVVEHKHHKQTAALRQQEHHEQLERERRRTAAAEKRHIDLVDEVQRTPACTLCTTLC